LKSIKDIKAKKKTRSDSAAAKATTNPQNLLHKLSLN
jgi:hypothetical protein